MKIFDLARERNLVERIETIQAPERIPDVEWVYVDPIAPASGGAVDDLSPVWENSWGNLAGQSPMSFSMDALGRVFVRGGFTGGAMNTVMFTLPVGYRPEYGQRSNYPKDDFGTVGVVRVDPDGKVWVLS